MKVTQEKLPASRIGLEIEIPAETGKKTYEKVVQDLARSTNIPGFRRGKVPRQVLLQRIGSQRIKAATLEELINTTLEQAVKQESIDSLGNYQLRSSFEELVQNFTPGEPLTYSASVDVPPEVKLEDYKGLSIKAEETTYDPEKVDDFLKQRQVQQATMVPVEDRAAELSDVAIIDYEGRRTEAGEDSEPLEGVQATDFQLELEEGRFIEGFVKGIVGMKPGESKDLPVTFPEDYPREDLAGVPVTFSIALKELKAKELPELNDDFAQEVSEFETMQEFRESVESQFKEGAEEETKASIQQALVAELVKKAEIDLPESMIEQEIQTILTQTAMQMSQYGMDINMLFTRENLPQLKARSRPDAIQRLQQSLVLTEVAKRESLQPTAEEIETRYNEVLEQLSDREVDKNRLRELIEGDLQREKALDLLQENAHVELVPKGSLSEETTEETTEENAGDATVEVEATEATE